MQYYTRKLIKPEDLNTNNTLFGGALLRWIDEEAGIYAMSRLHTQKVVTKYISEINFVASARQGDVIEIGLQFVAIGTTSITFRCEVRNLFSRKTMISIDKIVIVQVDDQKRPSPHVLSVEDIQKSTTA